MKILLLIGFVLLVVGSFLLFNISLVTMAEEFIEYFTSKNTDIRSIIKKESLKKERGLINKIANIINETKNILVVTKRESIFTIVCIVSFMLLVSGIVFGTLINNYFLSFVLGGGLCLIPFWFIKLSANNYHNEINNELETALSIITTSYTRNNNIQIAIEENIDNINPPVQEMFLEFLYTIKYVTADISGELLKLSKKIDNMVFEEWCLTLVACQNNRNLKNTLPSIVGKLSDIRIVNDSLGVDIYAPLKDMLTMSVFLLGLPTLLYFLNKDWYNILVGTTVGKLAIAIDMLIVFLSINAGINITKPIQFRR